MELLYTSFMIEMVDSENRNGLKGQFNLAQGNALGLKADGEIVRAMSFFIGLLLFRTKKHEPPFLSENNELQFRLKKVFRLEYYVLADGFLMVFSLPRALPRAELNWPFRPRKLEH